MSIDKAYDSWAEIYDSNKNRTRDLDKEISQKILKESTYAKILELGCGTGKNTKWLIDICDQITAVDFSDNMLDVARKKISASKVSFQKVNLLEDWNIQNVDFDLVCCNLVLEHIENIDRIFAKAYQKLISKGQFFISELHPFKQYAGSKARYESEEGTKELEVYIHNISDFLNAAKASKFKLLKFNEWFDEPDEYNLPRLV